jgi:hypothetical protein
VAQPRLPPHKPHQSHYQVHPTRRPALTNDLRRGLDMIVEDRIERVSILNRPALSPPRRAKKRQAKSKTAEKTTVKSRSTTGSIPKLAARSWQKNSTLELTTPVPHEGVVCNGFVAALPRQESLIWVYSPTTERRKKDSHLS